MKMKILFTTEKKDAVSTILNLEKLELLNRISGVQFTAYQTDYENYDVVLLMGYDFNIKKIREKNNKILIGVIDPRPTQKKQPNGVDFILANGIEMEDYYYSYCNNIFRYYIYPQTTFISKKYKEKNKIILAYHGNKIHLEEAKHRIIDAIEKLAKKFDIELRIIYNFEKLGKLSWKPKNFKLNYIQWNKTAYGEYLSQSDIGIIPNIIPIQNEVKIKNKTATFRKKFNEDKTDYLLRFKPTSNAGRIFPFMQYEIPVVSDMFPSALQLIDDGEDSFIAYNTNSWYFKLKKLAKNVSLRKKMGKVFREKFEKKYTADILNNNLISFLQKLLNQHKNNE